MRLAAWMPAMRATARASPLGTPLAAQQLDHSGRDEDPSGLAVAVRAVTVLAADVDHPRRPGRVEVREP